MNIQVEDIISQVAAENVFGAKVDSREWGEDELRYIESLGLHLVHTGNAISGANFESFLCSYALEANEEEGAVLVPLKDETLMSTPLRQALNHFGITEEPAWRFGSYTG